MKTYDKRAEFDSKLRDYMYSLYLKYWKFLRTLSCKEREPIEDYKASYAGLFNAMLYFPDSMDRLRAEIGFHIDHRIGLSSLKSVVEELLLKFLDKIKVFDQIFQKAPRFEKSVVVYRGIRGSIATKILKMKKGEELVTRNFSSTAFDINVALAFATHFSHLDNVLLRIQLPVGSPHILLPGGPHQKYGETTFKQMMSTVRTDYDQTELLLNRGSRMLIMGYGKQRLSPLSLEQKTYMSKGFIHMVDVKLLLDPAESPSLPLPNVDDIIKQIQYLEINMESAE